LSPSEDARKYHNRQQVKQRRHSHDTSTTLDTTHDTTYEEIPRVNMRMQRRDRTDLLDEYEGGDQSKQEKSRKVERKQQKKKKRKSRKKRSSRDERSSRSNGTSAVFGQMLVDNVLDYFSALMGDEEASLSTIESDKSGDDSSFVSAVDMFPNKSVDEFPNKSVDDSAFVTAVDIYSIFCTDQKHVPVADIKVKFVVSSDVEDALAAKSPAESPLNQDQSQLNKPDPPSQSSHSPAPLSKQGAYLSRSLQSGAGVVSNRETYEVPSTVHAESPESEGRLNTSQYSLYSADRLAGYDAQLYSADRLAGADVPCSYKKHLMSSEENLFSAQRYKFQPEEIEHIWDSKTLGATTKEESFDTAATISIDSSTFEVENPDDAHREGNGTTDKQKYALPPSSEEPETVEIVMHEENTINKRSKQGLGRLINKVFRKKKKAPNRESRVPAANRSFVLLQTSVLDMKDDSTKPLKPGNPSANTFIATPPHKDSQQLSHPEQATPEKREEGKDEVKCDSLPKDDSNPPSPTEPAKIKATSQKELDETNWVSPMTNLRSNINFSYKEFTEWGTNSGNVESENNWHFDTLVL
jgi:hypothetical protein